MMLLCTESLVSRLRMMKKDLCLTLYLVCHKATNAFFLKFDSRESHVLVDCICLQLNNAHLTGLACQFAAQILPSIMSNVI